MRALDISTFLSHYFMVPHTLLFDKSKFSLDALGVMGVFGGGEAVSAMATIHVYENRRWLGWFNSPGSYQIARRYGRVPSSGFFDGFSSGVNINPAALFNLDGLKGPKFRATLSGTVIEETGHLAALFAKECASLEGRTIDSGRKTQPVGFTVADLKHTPSPQMNPKFLGAYTPIFAGIPIVVSVSACTACGIFQDWYAFAMILLGILTNGIACLVIGAAKFTFTHPSPAEGAPAGDGILISGGQIVFLKGAEGAVNCITCGRFLLDFSSKPRYQDIGWCSVLFIIQFIAQLVLIPQAGLFGQIMFGTSLAVSWIYNLWLSSLNKKIQRRILLDDVLGKPVLSKYILGTRTAMAVFILLVLQVSEPRTILDELLPNDTKVWRHWKGTILQRLADKDGLKFTVRDWKLTEFTDDEQMLLENLYGDAEAAYHGYVQYPPPV